MERAFVTFVTDHHSNVTLCKMQSIDTMSADRPSPRLHTWAIYLDQYRDHMHVVYSKGADQECPDTLSRLCYDISLGAKHLRDWATRLASPPEMEEFNIQEYFAVTRLGKLHIDKEKSILPEKPVSATAPIKPVVSTASIASISGNDIQTEVEGMTVKLVPAYADKHCLATQNSQRIRAVYNTLKRDGTYNSRLNAISIPDTCQYVLQDDLLYLIDPKDKRLRLVLSSQELHM